ncbi:hypothetical protein C7974DRAFT_171823 [Boeremia exigua]|uniref:uncharacterized protein n=1 Tax=Boeremia exigua TaxID=749465 RepID=UPI001E8E7F16|nr:uncharacterized protein C7974DRAFT_171823 [Boeremia exigua]KAH6633448.1 hypothetical protein C7974DRAFT_171823 [Boeremia exigua]
MMLLIQYFKECCNLGHLPLRILLSGVSAYKMNLPTKLQPRIPTTCPTAVTMPENKPRKVNSEVRKQQNRIASRNYREKRKRKLQRLQQLLKDDEPGEKYDYNRSTSPYEDRSGSGSIFYERSVASASPHSAALSCTFSSPQPDHSATFNQTWMPHITTSSEQISTYNNSYSSPAQQMMAYTACGPAFSSQSTWNPFLSSTGITQSPPLASYHSLDPSNAYYWSSSDFESMYTHTMNPEEAATSSYMPSWQHHIGGEVPAGVAFDPYGRNYYRYKPQ